MPRVVSFDTSHRERRRIVRLLDFLKRESLTRDQLERIGRRLQKSGRRALPPLVRRLWHEQDRERLYRYTCMLDFFDAAGWLDQLVQLTIKRRDLGDEGRIPLLEILQDYGVDVTVPPFARQELNGSSLNGFLDACLQEGIWGQVRFMDRFLDADEVLRTQLIRRLGNRDDRGADAAALLRMLAYFEYREVAEQAVEALGSLRHPCALQVLRQLCYTVVSDLEERIERSIKRLGFLGVRQEEPLPEQYRPGIETVTTQSGPIDCYGVRTLWFSWRLADGSLAALVAQIGEGEGVLHAVHSRFASLKEHDDYLDEVNTDEGMFPVEPDYLCKVLKDALQQSIERNFYLPPDLYAARALFGEQDLRPEQYLPGFQIEALDGLVERLAALLGESDTLFDEPFFEGWLFSDPLVYELAESVSDRAVTDCSSDELDPLLERFCTDLIEPNKLHVLRRLLLCADLMQQCGAEQDTIQRVLAVALSLVGAPLPLSHHPFIRRLALDSIEIARQSLDEGFDPRRRASYDDEEWE